MVEGPPGIRVRGLVSPARRLAFGLLLAIARAASAAEPDSLARSFALIDEGRVDEARAGFEAVLAQARASSDAGAEAEARRGLGLLSARAKDPTAARDHYAAALALHRGQGNHQAAGQVLNHLGLLAWSEGDWKSLRESYGAAIVEFEAAGAPGLRAAAMRSLTFDQEMKRADKLVLLEQAQAIAREAGDGAIEGAILHHWGDMLFGGGEFAAAELKLEAARPLIEATGNSENLARLLTSLGRTYRAHGRGDQALELYGGALALQEARQDHLGMSQTENAIGVALVSLGRPDEAYPHMEKALALARRSGSARAISFQALHLGETTIERGDFRRGVALIEEGLSLDRNPSHLTSRYRYLARGYAALKMPREALAAADRAVELAPASAQAEDQYLALVARAGIHADARRDAEALADVEAALEKVEGLRERLVPDDFLKRGFGEQHRRTFDLAIGLLLRQDRALEALEVSEQARARAFLDLLATRDGAGPVRATSAGIGSATNAEPRLASPASERAIGPEAILGLPARFGSTVLSYWVGEQAVVVWAMGADGQVHVARSEVTPERLRFLVRAVWAGDQEVGNPPVSVAARGGTRLSLGRQQLRACRILYDLLVRPVARWLPRGGSGQRLTIVPHGPLFGLSFAVLIGDPGRYLVEDYAIHYGPSLSVLALPRAVREARRPGRALLVADPVLSQALQVGRELPPLPGAREEARAIARLFATDDVRVLEGGEADETQVRAALAGREIVHFATHGVVDDERPFDSFLALGGEGGGLTSADVYGLRLAADLVVLSGCRTGDGRVTGDGVLGLSRAFLSAGAASLVVSLWDLSDDAARHLTPAFYASWIRSGDKTEALRQAQLQTLRLLRAGRVITKTARGNSRLPEHPALWGSVVLVGEP